MDGIPASSTAVGRRSLTSARFAHRGSRVRRGVLRRDVLAGPGVAVARSCALGLQLVGQAEAQQRPDLGHRILTGDLAADLRVEVLGADARRLAGHGEAVAEHQDAEGQALKRLVAPGPWVVPVELTEPHVRAFGCGEVELAEDLRLNICGSDTGGVELLVSDLLFNQVDHGFMLLSGERVTGYDRRRLFRGRTCVRPPIARG